MAGLLKWREPRSVSDWELKHEGVPEFKNLFLVFWKWSIIIGVPVLVATWLWLPQGFLPVLYRLIICCTALPALFAAQVLVGNWTGTFCIIDKKGITKASGNSPQRYLWGEIESTHFDDYPHAPDVRQLTLRVRRKDHHFDRIFHFSPTDVNENELKVLLNQYLLRGS
jgi:hypothetical protein